MTKSDKWLSHRMSLEVFALLNLGFLGPDVYIAHSTNSMRHWEEWIPLAFSPTAAVLLALAAGGLKLRTWVTCWRIVGFVVGFTSVAIGIAGLIYHLQSHFFQDSTLRNLVYAAPFVAPLAYTGVGLLLVMNRMVDADSLEWAQWVILLAWGGFVGNFVLSVTDHAQNGFFHETEWIPVASSAFAIGFLLIPLLGPVRRSFLFACWGIVALQVVVGLLGFYYHNAANLAGPSPDLFDNLVYGAPPFAPLLLPNLALLTAIGLWALAPHAVRDVPQGLPHASAVKQ